MHLANKISKNASIPLFFLNNVNCFYIVSMFCILYSPPEKSFISYHNYTISTCTKGCYSLNVYHIKYVQINKMRKDVINYLRQTGRQTDGHSQNGILRQLSVDRTAAKTIVKATRGGLNANFLISC